MEMLDLGEGNVVEKLDKELAGDVSLVAGESFNGDEDGRGGNNEGYKAWILDVGSREN